MNTLLILATPEAPLTDRLLRAAAARGRAAHLVSLTDARPQSVASPETLKLRLAAAPGWSGSKTEILLVDDRAHPYGLATQRLLPVIAAATPDGALRRYLHVPRATANDLKSAAVARLAVIRPEQAQRVDHYRDAVVRWLNGATIEAAPTFYRSGRLCGGLAARLVEHFVDELAWLGRRGAIGPACRVSLSQAPDLVDPDLYADEILGGRRAPRTSIDDMLGRILADTERQAPSRHRRLPPERMTELAALAKTAAVEAGDEISRKLASEPGACDAPFLLQADVVATAIARQSIAYGRDKTAMAEMLGANLRFGDGEDLPAMGRGPDLVLLGPPGVSPYFLAPLAAALSQRFRVRLWSPPGASLEVAGLSRAVDASEMVQALCRTLARALPAPAPVVAWCGGARLAAALVAERPDMVRCVSLLAPDLGADLRGTSRSIVHLYDAYLRRPERTERHLRALGRILAEGDLLDMGDGEQAEAGPCAIAAQPLDDVRPLIGALLQPSAALAHYARYVVDDLLERPRPGLHAALATRPCQVLFAEDDDMIDNRRAAERLAFSSDQTSLSFSGHYFVADRAGHLARRIGDFIDRETARQRADEIESARVGAPLAASLCG